MNIKASSGLVERKELKLGVPFFSVKNYGYERVRNQRRAFFNLEFCPRCKMLIVASISCQVLWIFYLLKKTMDSLFIINSVIEALTSCLMWVHVGASHIFGGSFQCNLIYLFFIHFRVGSLVIVNIFFNDCYIYLNRDFTDKVVFNCLEDLYKLVVSSESSSKRYI